MTSKPRETPPPADWNVATWDGARQATLLDGARMTLIQKMEWLQAATRATDHLHHSALRRLRQKTTR